MKDVIHDVGGTFIHVAIPESEDLITFVAQISVPRHVMRSGGVKPVLIAVELDDKARRVNKKIGDVRPDWNLPFEFQPA